MKSLNLRPREDLLCFACFFSFFFFKAEIYLTFFSLFMGSQSSRKSNMVEMSVPICDGCGYFLLIFNDSFFVFLF